MEELQKAFGDCPDVAVADGEEAESGQNHDHALGEFDGGDRPQAFDVFGVVNVPMHARVGETI